MKQWLKKYADDLLLVLGCLIILTGLALWNMVVMLITAGAMLIGFSFLIGKVRSNAPVEPVEKQ